LAKSSLKNDTTELWALYQAGLGYNNKIGYGEMCNRNEAMVRGEQWRGVNAPGLDKPVFNVFGRVLSYFQAQIMSSPIAMQFSASEIEDDPQNEMDKYKGTISDKISSYSKNLWEREKLDYKLRVAIKDAAVTADMAAYTYWDNSIDDFRTEIIDGTNVFFGNPNSKEVEGQPYILISFRKMVEAVKEEAKALKLSEFEINMITSDSDYTDQSGYNSNIELESGADETKKCIVLIKLWKKDGKIWFCKATKGVNLVKDVELPLTRYPLAWGNWDTTKGSYHGNAPVTNMIPNQIFINKMFAMIMASVMLSAFPRIAYDKTRISGLSNMVGAAIPVDGEPTNLIKIIEGGSMSSQVMQVVEFAIQYTKEMMGATDVALGNTKIDNNSAIISLQKAAAVPLELIKMNLYQFVEDIGRIWVDFMAGYYGQRQIIVTEMGKKFPVTIDFILLKEFNMGLKIDVGASSYWSEIAMIQTLEGLRNANILTAIQYIERIPEGFINKRAELVTELKMQDKKSQVVFEAMAKFLDGLPPEVTLSLQRLKPQDMEDKVMEMILMTPEQLQIEIQDLTNQLPKAPPQNQGSLQVQGQG